MYKITYKSPTHGKGEKVTVAGLGELINGETVEFPDSVNETFRAANAVIDYDDDGIPVVKSGPSLISAFRKHNAITVKHEKDKPEDPDVVDEDENPGEGGVE